LFYLFHLHLHLHYEYECELSEKKKEGTSTSEERHEPLHVPLRYSRSCHCRPLSEHTTARWALSSLYLSLCFFFYKLFSEKLFYWKDWLSLGLKRLSTKKLAADLIVKNAVIFTSDASMPVADSMAIQNGRILRVGNFSSLQVSLPPPPLVFWITEQISVKI
jgi:hypothetical protein